MANIFFLQPMMVNMNPSRAAKLQWPLQLCPAPLAWSQWRQFLAVFSPSGRLSTPLGAWTHSVLHQEWQWFYHCPSNTVY
jgi:hypothetical protein